MTPPPRILIADDHPLFRLALSEAVRSALPGARLEQTSTLGETIAALDSGGGADLVLLDLMMPGAMGFSGLLCLRVEHPETPVAIVSGVDDPRVMRKALHYGASGYIPKSLSPSGISTAIAAIFAGETFAPGGIVDADGPPDEANDLARRLSTLSPQQFRVLRLIAEGKLNKEIAHELDLSLSTVKAHMTALLKKLGLARRTQILAAMQTLDLSGYAAPDAL